MGRKKENPFGLRPEGIKRSTELQCLVMKASYFSEIVEKRPDKLCTYFLMGAERMFRRNKIVVVDKAYQALPYINATPSAQFLYMSPSNDYPVIPERYKYQEGDLYQQDCFTDGEYTIPLDTWNWTHFVKWQQDAGFMWYGHDMNENITLEYGNMTWRVDPTAPEIFRYMVNTFRLIRRFGGAFQESLIRGDEFRWKGYWYKDSIPKFSFFTLNHPIYFALDLDNTNYRLIPNVLSWLSEAIQRGDVTFGEGASIDLFMDLIKFYSNSGQRIRIGRWWQNTLRTQNISQKAGDIHGS
jgi:hypothetical protein